MQYRAFEPGIEVNGRTVKVVVDGHCEATTATSEPPPAPKPPPILPGSGDWNRLYTAWGSSNYARKQPDGKGYARYADVVKLNNDLGAVVKAGRVEAAAYAELMKRWDVLTADAGFKAAMAAIVPSTRCSPCSINISPAASRSGMRAGASPPSGRIGPPAPWASAAASPHRWATGA